MISFHLPLSKLRTPRKLVLKIGATRFLLYLSCAVLTCVSITNFLVSPPKVSAEVVLQPCVNTFLETWDWPADMRRGTINSVTYGAGVTTFDPSKDSYIIFKPTSSETASPKRNVFNFVLKQNARLWLKNVSGVPTVSDTASGSTSKSQGYIQSEPRNMVPSGYYVWPSGYDDVNTGSNSNASGDVALNPTNVSCVYAAVNVDYDQSWGTWNKFSGAALYKEGADAAVSCTRLDIACQIGKAWGNVTDSFKAVGQAIIEGIASFFMPRSDEIKTQFDDFNSFMSAKLGFLTYPFTFLQSVFNAFTDTSNQWCTASGCNKSFGNFLGQNFTVNLNQAGATMPTLWTWFTAFIRGTTILAIVLAMRKKFIGVIHK